MNTREIKFRGKRLDNGEWVYGSLLQSEIEVGGYCRCQIHERFADDFSISSHSVDPKTVGQYVGFRDHNGKEMYEGDLLKVYVGHESTKQLDWKVVFRLGAFQIEPIGALGQCAFITMAQQCFDKMPHFVDMEQVSDYLQVIGNIYENPELLQKEVVSGS